MNKNVSVIIPVYNGLEFVRDSISSILCQTYADFHLLIIDDGSTENIRSVVDSFNDERIKFFSRRNKGLGATLNELVAKSKSDIIFRMDADDISHPQRIEKQLIFLRENPDVVLCGTQINFFNEYGKVKARRFPIDNESILKDLLNTKFSICHPSIVFKKTIFDLIGGYKTKGAGEDLDFFLNMSLYGKLANIDEILLDYRIHENSLNTNKIEELETGYINAIHRYKKNYTKDLESLKASSFSILKRKYQTKFYRSYISNLIRKDFFRAYIYLFLTAIVNPFRAYYFIMSKIRKTI